MSCHVAIVTPAYGRMILDSRKTVECRLTKTPLPPFGCITPGQRIFFKRSGGPFFASAVADRVWMTDSLTPRGVEELRNQHNAHIRGTADYFHQRAACRFATLVWLRDVRPCVLAPRYKPQNMRAWYTLDDAADPLRNAAIPARAPRAERSSQRVAPTGHFEVVLTRGCLSQSQVRLAACMGHFPSACIGGQSKARAGDPIRLELLGGSAVETDIVSTRKMFRWRGWAAWFARHGLEPGDRLRFTPSGTRAFRVEPVKANTDILMG